jgi:hypothetical protein
LAPILALASPLSIGRRTAVCIRLASIRVVAAFREHQFQGH